MDLTVWTWGTGAAFGRELGVPPTRARRHQVATSIIGKGNEETGFHFLVDAGAPCVETMVDSGVSIPDVLFITHPHADHYSDLDKLANNRLRGLSLLGKPLAPLPVICTRECLDHPEIGLKQKFEYLGGTVKWVPIRSYDVWYSIRRSDYFPLPTRALSGDEPVFPLSFKALPVYHAFAPGACLFIFSLRDESRRIVISGDFESIQETTMKNIDLIDADMYLLDTNTLKATGANHSNWEQNKYLISQWITGRSRTHILLHHLGGFEDYIHGYYDHIPREDDWTQEIEKYISPEGTNIELAEDGKRYVL